MRAGQAKTKPQDKTGGLIGAKVSNEVKLDPNQPVPNEYGFFSSFANEGSSYIPFLHPKDDYFTTLKDLRYQSVTQNACISTKTNYSVGEGLHINGHKVANNKKKTGIDSNIKEIIEYFKYVNNRRHNINEVIRKALDSFLTYGNVPIEFVRFKIKDKKFLYVYVKNVQDCRFGAANKNDEVTEVIISKSFRSSHNGVYIYDKDKTQSIPLYKRGPGDKKRFWKQDKDVERTMIWLTNDMAGFDYYGLPSSVSSVSEQKTEYEAIRYNLDVLENNMAMSSDIFIEGSLDQTEANKIANSILKRHTGKGKRGRTGVWSSEKGISNVTHVQHSNEKEGSYVELDNKVMSKIILANEWDAVLAGLQDKGALGKGSGYLQEVYYQKLQTVIAPLQDRILEGFIEILLEIADDWFGKNWSEQEYTIKPAKITNTTSELIGTTKGLESFLKIVQTVASGAYPIEAAIKLVASRFGMSEEEAKEQLGNINVRSNKTNQKGTDQSL